jgi:Protein of unknown function (DUF3467)
MSNPTEQQQLNIEISEEVSEGAYANLAIITHSHAEFVVDFVNVMPGTPKSKVKSRIILTPFHAKRFMKAMVEKPMAPYRIWKQWKCPLLLAGHRHRHNRGYSIPPSAKL